MHPRTKYPRTLHVPWSPGLMNDDRAMDHLGGFVGLDVVVTEKLDGENTTLYADGLHARSIDGRHHPSRDWVKAAHGRVAWTIPEGWRICGENMYAPLHPLPVAGELLLHLLDLDRAERLPGLGHHGRMGPRAGLPNAPCSLPRRL